MRLDALISGFDGMSLKGEGSVDILGITCDSRDVGEGFLYVAIKGDAHDGRDFIGNAIKKGAKAVVAEEGSSGVPSSIAAVSVPGSRRALGELASRFFGSPSERLKLTGITGTNGKTTTAYLLENIISEAGMSPGVMGTVNYRYGGFVLPAPNTTPPAHELQGLLARMVEAGTDHCVMEVSSHALDQERVAGCSFHTVVFTNLTRDHIDYHRSMEEYGRAKERLFNRDESLYKRAVINTDDPFGKLLAEKSEDVITYGLKDAQIFPVDVSEDEDGMRGTVKTPEGTISLESPLIGSYNLYNIMAAIGAAVSLNIEKVAIEEGLRSFTRVPGRIERVNLPSSFKGFRVFVDYAHTPDALERVIKTVRPTTRGRLITIFGCGGDRDRDKRGLMGGIAVDGSDLTIITSDNPRSEEPLSIIGEIETGARGAGAMEGEDYLIIADRREAIMEAARISREGDTILVAGKGHEDYQIIGDMRTHFDDREEIEKAYAGLDPSLYRGEEKRRVRV